MDTDLDLCLHIMILIRNDIMLRVRYVHDTDTDSVLMFQILVVIRYMILIILS